MAVPSVRKYETAEQLRGKGKSVKGRTSLYNPPLMRLGKKGEKGNA